MVLNRVRLRLASVNVADTCCVDRHLDHVAGPCASVLPMLVATSFVQSVERYAAGPAGLLPKTVKSLWQERSDQQ